MSALENKHYVNVVEVNFLSPDLLKTTENNIMRRCALRDNMEQYRVTPGNVLHTYHNVDIMPIDVSEEDLENKYCASCCYRSIFENIRNPLHLDTDQFHYQFKSGTDRFHYQFKGGTDQFHYQFKGGTDRFHYQFKSGTDQFHYQFKSGTDRFHYQFKGGTDQFHYQFKGGTDQFHYQFKGGTDRFHYHFKRGTDQFHYQFKHL